MTHRTLHLWSLALACWGALLSLSTAAAQDGHAEHRDLPPVAVTATSLYQVTSVWTTATAQRLQLRDLQGKVQVLAMVYTTCDSACPLLVAHMQRLEAELPPALRSQVGFVLVTFDPERDTPAALRVYSDKMHLDSQAWTLLHGQPEDILELAVLLGVKYTKDNKGGFAHSNLLTVLNTRGEIVHRHVGFQQPLDTTLAAITNAAEATP